MAELLRARGAAGRPIDLRSLFASLRKPPTDRLHLTRDQFIVLALVRTYERADGWSSAPGELGWSHRTIGEMTGTSAGYAKHVVRDMRRRNIIRTPDDEQRALLPSDGAAAANPGAANPYKALPPAEWKPLSASLEKRTPRPRTITLRMQRRQGRLRVAIPGKGSFEIPGEPEARIGALGQDPALTVRGEVSLRVPEAAAIELSPAVRIEPEKSAQKGTGVARNPGVQKVNGQAENVPSQLPGSPATPLSPPEGWTSQTYRLPDGVLRAEWREDRRFLTQAARRELGRVLAAGRGVDHLEAFFAVQGIRTTIIERTATQETSTALPSAEKKLVQLDGPPTGLWGRALHILQGRMNRHSFESWFLGTREAGTLNGGIVIAVGTRLHVQRLHKHYGEQIREVLQRIAHRDLRFQFVATDGSDDIGIVAPPDSGAEAGENLQRRTA